VSTDGTPEGIVKNNEYHPIENHGLALMEIRVAIPEVRDRRG